MGQQTFAVPLSFTKTDDITYTRSNLGRATIHPVRVDNHEIGFDLLEDLSLIQKVDLESTDEVLPLFKFIVNNIKTVVDMQVASFNDESSYRPMWLLPGRDDHKGDVDYLLIRKLCFTLFPSEATYDILYDWCPLKIDGTLRVPKSIRDQKEKFDQEELAILEQLQGDLSSITEDDFYEAANILRMEKVSLKFRLEMRLLVLNFFDCIKEKETTATMETRLEILTTLSKSLEKCRVKWGNFSGNLPGPRPTDEELEKMMENHEQNKILLELKKQLDLEINSNIQVEDGKESALQKLIVIAQQEGKAFGRDRNVNTFYKLPPWRGYQDSKTDQEKYPVYGAYLEWHPDIRKAFINAYREAVNAPYHLDLKLPLDPPQPFFTDPAARFARIEGRIADGIDKKEDSEQIAHHYEQAMLESLVDGTIRELKLKLGQVS